MSAQRTLRRTATTFAMACGAAVAVLVPAAAAYAEDAVRVSISGLNDTQTAGHLDGFSVRFENRSNKPIIDLHAAIVVHLDGLQPGQVHVFRNGGELAPSTNGGDMVFTDPQPWLGLARAQRSYQILFQPEAPTGDGEVAAIALDASGSQLGSASTSFGLRAGDGRVGPTPSHSASPAATVNVSIPTGPAVSIAPLGDNGGRTTPLASDAGGVPVYLYIMGAILVVIGAVILWLVFRAPRPAVGDGVHLGTGPTTGPGLGYSSGPRMTAPTAMLPVVRDPRAATGKRLRHDVNASHGPKPPHGSGRMQGPDRGGGQGQGTAPGLDTTQRVDRRGATTEHPPRVPSAERAPIPPGVDPWS